MKKTQNKNLTLCSNCLVFSTRPRITFDENGLCSACQWMKAKKEEVDWNKREKELDELINKYKARSLDKFDVIAPSSGGKDSSYVAWQLKEKLGLKPLLATVNPPLPYDVGIQNLEESIKRGFDHIRITPNYEMGRVIAKKAFMELGQPLMAWMMSVQTTLFRLAVLFDIPFVMFGEEGEAEYGGSKELQNKATYGIEESIKLYLSGNTPKDFIKEYGFSDKDLYWWSYPSKEEFRALEPAIAHWSYFESWDSIRNYELARDKMGLRGTGIRSIGTYNDFAQTDTKLYDLHVYLMFLKFGFGRCTQDVCIDIRRGAMTRQDGIELVKKYDGEYPDVHIVDYLEYFRMKQAEFDAVIDKWANKDLFEKVGGRWMPKFELY